MVCGTLGHPDWGFDPWGSSTTLHDKVRAHGHLENVNVTLVPHGHLQAAESRQVPRWHVHGGPKVMTKTKTQYCHSRPAKQVIYPFSVAGRSTQQR